jgi:alkylhydroperoxidase family enzyme
MQKQRISYVHPEPITNPDMQAELERCRIRGTPHPERVHVSHSGKCEFCGNQRSIPSREKGLIEDDYFDLLNFEKADRYDDRQKAALRYTKAIV